MRRGPAVAVIGGATALALAAAAVVVWQPWRSTATDTDTATDVATATVERATLTSDLVLNGSLSYGTPIDLPGRGGIITGLPTAGDEIAVGQSVYEVDGMPVVAVRGDRPFWRTLAEGIPNGPDVRQLEQYLTDSGFGDDLTVDDEFTSITTKRVKEWQKRIGVEQTGGIALGDIVAVGSDSIRVDKVTAKLGDSAAQSPMSYSSTRLRVVAKLTDAQARELQPATAVTVTLPDGSELGGAITEIDPGGTPVGDEGKTTPPTAVVDLDEPAAAAGIGLRAVKVALAASEAKDALVVPVTALLATVDDGYAVDVLRDGETVRIPVELGLIADTRAQVLSDELVEGDTVVVAS
jgi:peptidoglycan hydrolase-like protein with peptidoglycan-binding domain